MVLSVGGLVEAVGIGEWVTPGCHFGAVESRKVVRFIVQRSCRQAVKLTGMGKHSRHGESRFEDSLCDDDSRVLIKVPELFEPMDFEPMIQTSSKQHSCAHSNGLKHEDTYSETQSLIICPVV